MCVGDKVTIDYFIKHKNNEEFNHFYNLALSNQRKNIIDKICSKKVIK